MGLNSSSQHSGRRLALNYHYHYHYHANRCEISIHYMHIHDVIITEISMQTRLGIAVSW